MKPTKQPDPPNNAMEPAASQPVPRRRAPQSLVTKLSVRRIEALVEKTHLTQTEIGRLAGVSQSWMGSLMRGEVEPGEKVLHRLHDTLDAMEATLLPGATDGQQPAGEGPADARRRLPRGRVLGHEQMLALLAASPGWLADWILWAKETGARPNELAVLLWRDVDLRARQVRLRSSKTDRAVRKLRLSDLLYSWCLRFPKARPGDLVLRSGPGLARELAAAGKRAGLGPVTPMTIRRSIAHACIEAARHAAEPARPTLH